MSFGNGGDLLSNFNLHSWLVGCHSAWDLMTTVTGDLALTRDEAENNRQRLLMWMALPKGERLNPSLGCCLHDYFHEKITGNIGRRIELDLKKDLTALFPNLSIKNIAVDSITPLSGGIHEMQIEVSLGDDSFQFVANWNEIAGANDTINSIMYTEGHNW